MNYLFNYLPRLSVALAGEKSVRALLLYIVFVYFVFSRILFTSLRKRDYIIRGIHHGKQVIYRLNQPIDTAPLIEVYVFREYDWDCGFIPQTILDLGAHFGDTALYYNAVYPNAKIIAVEPDPANFARLKKNVAAYKNIIPVHCAVGPENGTATLFLAQNGLGHSTAERKESHGSVQVMQATLDEILSEQGLESVDLLKFDIEGAETVLFKNSTLAQKSRAFIGELHFDLNSELKMEDINDRFKDLSVTLVPTLKKTRFILKAV